MIVYIICPKERKGTKMNYICLDLEFNGAFDFSAGKAAESNEACHHEIIQIGAVKLDKKYNIKDSFNTYVKPTIYPRLNPFIADVIKMKTEDFKNAGSFKINYLKFKNFLSDGNNVFVVWGESDIPILYENLSYYKLVDEPLIVKYMNIQPYVSTLLNKESGQQISLKNAIDAMGIETDNQYHNALYDAYYTAQIFINLDPKPNILKLFCSNHYKNLK